MKTQEPDTLLDTIVAEGIADSVALQVSSYVMLPWPKALDRVEESQIWPRGRRRLAVSDPTEIRRYLYGDGAHVPQWTGYFLGYQVVTPCLNHHRKARPSSLAGLAATRMFAGSGYDEPG